MRKFFYFFLIFAIANLSCETGGEDDQPVVTKIYLDSNGVTIKCEDCKPGDRGLVNGVEYEVVDNQLLRQMRDQGADMTKLCTSLVTTTNGLFDGFPEFNQSIGNWDVGNVTDMSEMFFDSETGNSSFNQPISSWDVSKVTNMSGMFEGSLFNQPIGSWDVSNVSNMRLMFSDTPFNQLIDEWDVSNVVDMAYMFLYTPFNQPIGNWNVRNVTDMAGMFQGASFNQDISGWCVSKITSEPDDFSFNSPLTPENKPKWGTCPH